MATEQLFVKSHVARDLLQSAGLFKTEKLVVWEYVSNSLQYVDPGVNPVVHVKLDWKNKRIAIEDNGRGMLWDDLANFFVMHGENVDRKRGAAGRGRFGTGKSAAFGIAETLRVTTVREGKQSKVELHRSEIDKMTSEDPIPVKTLEREVATGKPNGTIVEIEGLHLKALDSAAVIAYIERHLARWSRNSTVFVNNHECEVWEPPISETYKFSPTGEQAAKIGPVELTIHSSKVHLEEGLRGVSIYSKGVWHETTLAGNEGREMTQYVFGEIEVPKLDEDKSPISPFDISRSMRLNPSNELVQVLHAFVGKHIDGVRRTLLQAEKKRKESEEAKKLREQASEIASLLNEDFQDFKRKLAKAKTTAAGGGDFAPGGEDGLGDILALGGDEPVIETYPPQTDVPVTRHGKPPELESDPQGEKKGKKIPGGSDDKPKPRGGFNVDFDNMGDQTARAQYVSESRTIFVNLDHPQIAAAKGLGSVEEPAFRRLAYEVAFSEYAVALASELAARDQYIDPTDPIVDIRETLNRLARKGAKLYTD
jgi:hypothetical protein